MATRDKPLKDLVGVWPIFGYKFWIQILHSDLERGECHFGEGPNVGPENRFGSSLFVCF